MEGRAAQPRSRHALRVADPCVRRRSRPTRRPPRRGGSPSAARARARRSAVGAGRRSTLFGIISNRQRGARSDDLEGLVPLGIGDADRARGGRYDQAQIRDCRKPRDADEAAKQMQAVQRHHGGSESQARERETACHLAVDVNEIVLPREKLEGGGRSGRASSRASRGSGLGARKSRSNSNPPIRSSMSTYVSPPPPGWGSTWSTERTTRSVAADVADAAGMIGGRCSGHVRVVSRGCRI